MIYFSASQQAFFDDDIHTATQIPDDVIAIDSEQHQNLLTALNQGARIMPDLSISHRPSALHQWYNIGQEWVLPENALAEALQSAKDAKLNALNQAAQNYINQVAGIDKLPQFEVDTWTLQALEAKAWASDENAATPTLDTIAIARGIAPKILKQKALEKARKFEMLTANVVGIRQAIETHIKKAKSIEELDAIEFSFGEHPSIQVGSDKQ